MQMTEELQLGRGLEVLDRGACSEEHPVPLLFVHGAWHGAWCWERFLDFFAAKGYRALALSLRGHGSSPPPKRARGDSLADYIDDMKSVAETLPSMPVLIGHSMGGFIIQKYLESNEAPAGVLVASAPPQGGGRLVLSLMRRHPWLMARSFVTGDSLHGYNTPAIVRKLFFSEVTPEDDVVRYAAMLCNESQRVSLDVAIPNRLKPERVTTPLLVLGASLDACITTAEVHDTARAYGTDPEIFQGMGHNMMLEPEWASVAERIHAWLVGRGL
jgi:alpha-beta hydrolase superfamily lysophospholipase